MYRNEIPFKSKFALLGGDSRSKHRKNDIREDANSSKVGVEALGLLLHLVAKYGALNGEFLYEISMALLPACLLRGKLTTLRLVPIFRLLYIL